MFKSATFANRLRKKPPKKSYAEDYLSRVRENIKYEQLIQSTVEAQSQAQAAVDEAFPALQRAMKRRQRTRLAIQGELDALADGVEDKDEVGIALYHAAIRPAQPQTTTIDRAPLALTSNRNCSIDICNMPPGTTTGMVLDAIAQFRPVGEVYDAHLTQIEVDDDGVPLHDPFSRPLVQEDYDDHHRHHHSSSHVFSSSSSSSSSSYFKHKPVLKKHVCVARVRFKAAHSAARLFQIGNKPGLGLRVQGVRVVVVFTAHPRPCMENEDGTRVVVFRGPREVVAPENLRRVWGSKFLVANTQKVIVGPVGADGKREVEWWFYSFWWGAEVAHSLFRCEYRGRGDCEVRYGKDPCA